MPADPRTLLSRITAMPNLARAVPLLPAGALHAAVRQLGLDQCVELLALATPAQIAAVLDLDLWRAGRPGADHGLDADRFCEWVDAMADADVDGAADRFAALDPQLVSAALARSIAVFDRAAAPPALTEGASSHHIGGYVVVTRVAAHADAIAAVLLALDERHPDAFHRVMRGCRRLSNSAPEADGFHILLGVVEQFEFDLGARRNARRDEAGYVTPAEARALLSSARLAGAHAGRAAPGPMVLACRRAIAHMNEAHVAPRVHHSSAVAPIDEAVDPADVMTVLEMLHDAGAVQSPPRALLVAPAEERHPLIAVVREQDPALHMARMQEFAFLSNVLAAGGVLQGRAFTAREAADAVAAVCSLGIESWPGGAGADLLVAQELGAVFELGWVVLHRDVAMFAAERLLDVLARLRTHDRDSQVGLHALRATLARHWREGAPWHARDAMDALALLDLPTWAALRALVDECPVLLANVSGADGAGLRAVDPAVFTFIAERRQLASVRAFLDSLADRLTR